MDTTEYLDRKFASGKLRKCWMCACVLTRGTASVDHLQPKSKGGKDRADNYRLACKPCNAGRGNKVIPKRLRLELQGRPKPKPKDYSALAAVIRANRAQHEHSDLSSMDRARGFYPQDVGSIPTGRAKDA